MNITKTLLIAAPILMLPQLANAAVCQVDPAGAFGMPFASIDDALTYGGCDVPASVIEVYCPVGGCVNGSTTISGLNDIFVVSAEAWGFGKVHLVNSYSGNAVSIDNSTGIVFDGFDSYVANFRAIEIIDSDVSVLGPRFAGRYSHASALTAVYVEGQSDVDLHWLGLRGSTTGLEMDTAGAATGPKVLAEGIAAINNDVAVHMQGWNGPRLDLRSDFDNAINNYVMGNHEGVIVEGDGKAEIDHTIFAGNLRLRPGSPAVPHLLEVADSANMTVRNALIYDNDAKPNPGVQLPWSSWSSPTSCGGGPCLNTNGKILEHNSMGGVTILASTIIDNQTDIVFNVAATGSGQLMVDHSVMAHNWGKVFSMSSWWPGCPLATTAPDSYFWDNRIDFDPLSCPVGSGSWDPAAISGAFSPTWIPGYPNVPAPFTDLYLITSYEPSTTPLPGALYVGPTPWSVDGSTVEVGDLDVGYHNPM